MTEIIFLELKGRPAPENYRRLFEGFRQAVGICCPIWLYRPLSDIYEIRSVWRRLRSCLKCRPEAERYFARVEMEECAVKYGNIPVRISDTVPANIPSGF